MIWFNKKIDSKMIFGVLSNDRDFPFGIYGKELSLALLDKNGKELTASDYKRKKLYEKDFCNGINVANISWDETKEDWGEIKFIALYKEDRILSVNEIKTRYVRNRTTLCFLPRSFKFTR